MPAKAFKNPPVLLQLLGLGAEVLDEVADGTDALLSRVPPQSSAHLSLLGSHYLSDGSCSLMPSEGVALPSSRLLLGGKVLIEPPTVFHSSVFLFDQNRDYPFLLVLFLLLGLLLFENIVESVFGLDIEGCWRL